MNQFEGGGAGEIIFSEEKQKQWNEVRDRIDKTTDPLGKSIEDGIKETVIASNVLELSTIGSCEGHSNWGAGPPRVEYRALYKPKERFIAERAIYEEVARKYGMSIEDVIQRQNANAKKAYSEALDKMAINGETDEYVAWRGKNTELTERLEILVEEFYEGREVPRDLRLMIKDRGGTGARLYNGGDDKTKKAFKLTADQRRELAKRLPVYREEMRAFTEFLKKKFAES